MKHRYKIEILASAIVFDKSALREQCKEIGKLKMEDLNCHDEDAAGRIIAGTARSMGIELAD